jgi:glycosyltransferase involved in cell wall biosynthesis
VIKSVHITNYYHKNSGGVSTSYNKLLEAAERNERFVRLIVPAENESVEEVNEFAKIYYVAAPSSPLFDKRYRVMMPQHYLFTDTSIRKILLDEMPDMIEVYDNSFLTYLAGMIRMNYFKKLGRPMLVYYTGERLDTIIKSFVVGGRLGKWFSQKAVGNFFLPMFDFYIANSPFVAEELFEAYQKQHNPNRFDSIFNACWRFFKASKIPFQERLAIIPRGVNTEFFNPNRQSEEFRQKIRQDAKIPANSIVLLSSTRISPEKNIQFLPEIMEILSKNQKYDFRLLVAGAGPKEDWLREETARKFPNKIVLIGHLDKENLANYYANADVFVHPNPREPFGNVVQEAMASGVPLVACNSGGVLATANVENAWLNEPTAEKFAEAILQAVENTQLREEKTSKALATARNNTQEKATDSLFEAYDRMFADFQARKELFTYLDKPKDFDFVKLLENV